MTLAAASMTEAMKANDTFNVGMRAEAAFLGGLGSLCWSMTFSNQYSYQLSRPFCELGCFSFNAILSQNHISKPIIFDGSTWSCYAHVLISGLGISGRPSAGSFVRPSRPSDPPLSFLDALTKKYNSSDGPEGTAAEQKIQISGKTVEEVGFDKINRQLAALQELKIVVLDGLCVAGVNSSPQELEDNASHPTNQISRWSFVEELKSKDLSIVELDLSRNLLETWIDVIGICGALKFLAALELKCVSEDQVVRRVISCLT